MNPNCTCAGNCGGLPEDCECDCECDICEPLHARHLFGLDESTADATHWLELCALHELDPDDTTVADALVVCSGQLEPHSAWRILFELHDAYVEESES